MDKKEREKRKKRLKLYERLGALKFQKVVFKVEEIKYKVIKRCFPNFIQRFDKYCDWKQRRALKRAKTEEERKAIKDGTKLAKMAIRKEMNEEKNRNYHMDAKRPTEIVKYLKWNKEVHKKGLTKDLALIPILIAGVVFHVPGATAFLVFELISAAINFECINIQNYNICRAEMVMPALERREQTTIQKSIEEYGGAAEVIHKSIEQSESLPTFDEIIDNIDNIEQLKQMRAMFQKSLQERQAQKSIGGK